MNPGLTVAIIGIGHIGAVHLQTARVHQHVNRTVAVDPDERQRELAGEIGADERYRSVDSLLENEQPDLTVIAVPPGYHLEVAEPVIEAGSNVFVEKPIARTPVEAAELIRLADSNNVAIGVDHTIRYQDDIRKLKSALDAGEFGAVPTCSIWRINNGPFDAPPANPSGPGWQLDPDMAGGGALLDLGVHLFDVVEWFFGEVSLEYASVDQVLSLPVEDAATVVLKTKSGTVATVTCGYFQWEQPPDITSGMRIDGIAASGSNHAYRPRNFYSHVAESALKNVIAALRGTDPAYFRPSYYYEAHFTALTECIDAIVRGDTPPVSGTDGKRMVDLVYEAYELAGIAPQPMEAAND